MELWTQILSLINESITLLTLNFSDDQALTIIVFTLFIKLLLMPLQIKSSIKLHENKSTISKLKPQLERLKIKYEKDPKAFLLHSSNLYKKHGISFVDRFSILNLIGQGGFGFAMFQTLQKLKLSSSFLWLENLAKPDVYLALVVGFLTYIATIITPGMAEQTNQMIVLLPALLSVIAVAFFPSAIGLYWATSNVITIIQSYIVNGLMKRRLHSIQ